MVCSRSVVGLRLVFAHVAKAVGLACGGARLLEECRAWKLLLVGRLLVVVARRFWSGLVLGGGRSAQSHTPIEGSSKLETPVVCGCRRVALKMVAAVLR